MTKLFIKNMVCPRCIMAVEDIIRQLNIDYQDIKLGEITIDKEISKEQIDLLQKELEAIGFELIGSEQQQIVERIKVVILEFVHYGKDQNPNFSKIISSDLNKDYSYLSKLFSATEGTTIVQYVILQKIERAKELLSYNKLTLSEIAIDMGYSSVAHLSSQFKKITNLTPSQFKSQGTHSRQGLNQVK